MERVDHRSPPRVGYVLRMYPRFSQTFIVNEILELERQGLDIRIASLRKPTEGRFHELLAKVRAEADYLPETLCGYAGKVCRVHVRAFWRAPRRYARALGVVLRYAGADWFDLVQAAFLCRWARKKRVDHIHVHFGTQEATVALLANILDGLPFSLAVHAVDLFHQNVDRALLAHKINASQFTVANTEFARLFLVEKVPGVDISKVRLSYNGVDLERFHPSDRRRRPNTLLSIGRLVEKKGFVHLVHAVRRLRDEGLPLKCKIVGEGPEKRRLKQEIERCGLQSQVVLTGPLQHDGVRALMQRYSCFVLSCVQAQDGNMDGIPNVLLEALASGCPVVSTSVSGVSEAIEHGRTGLLVEPGDEASLARAIREMLFNVDLARRCAESGRHLVEQRFVLEQNMRRLHDWLLHANRNAPTSGGEHGIVNAERGRAKDEGGRMRDEGGRARPTHSSLIPHPSSLSRIHNSALREEDGPCSL